MTAKVTRTCQYSRCKKSFLVFAYYVKAGRAKFCSLACSDLGRGEAQRREGRPSGNVKSLKGEVYDLLEVGEFVRSDRQGAIWSCTCECSNVVERHANVLKRNKRRGRKNGCDTCVPSRVHHTTNEQKRAARKARNDRHREKVAKERPVLERAAAPKPLTGVVYLLDGKPMGSPKNDRELAWLRWAFPGGEVVEVAA